MSKPIKARENQNISTYPELSARRRPDSAQSAQMKHQLKFIRVTVDDQNSSAIVDSIYDQRNGTGDTIKDAEVVAMREDYAALKRTNRQEELDEKSADKSKRTFSKDRLLDEERQRIKIWMETKDREGYDEVQQRDTGITKTEKRKHFDRYKHHQYVKKWGLFFESDGKDEEWFLPSPDVLDENDPEYLCDRCRHIDFRALLTQRGLPGNQKPGPTTIKVFDMAKLMEEPKCSFCSLLRRNLEYECSAQQLSQERLEGQTITLSVLDEGSEYSMRLEVEFGTLGDAFPRMIVQKLAEQNETPLQGLRVRRDAADLDQLRGWLRMCEHEHTSPDITPQQLLGSSTSDLRVIDIASNCVRSVAMPCEYACLSYVWGKGSQTQLTAETRQILEAPGGLTASSITLTQTIKDALQVTRELGLRYIWIDALCIQQDDETDKARIISQMSSIYGNCTLSIVASTNSSPEDGLPGISVVARSREQIVENLQGMSLAVAFHDQQWSLGEIEDSVWNSRAWTFQERQLSKRCVYFTSSHMSFTCPHGMFFEDTIPPPDPKYRPPPLSDQMRSSRMMDLHMYIWTEPTESIYPNKALAPVGEPTMTMVAEDPNNPGEPSPEPAPVYRYSAAPSTERTGLLQMQGETLWKSYSDAISTYTRRKLSFESDALNAFTGVADLIAQGVNTKYWYGLPEFAFDQALLWQPREALKRRCQGNAARFPSWSWVAWEGHSSYRSRGWYNAIYYPPLVVVKWLQKKDSQWLIDMFKAKAERTPEQIEAFTQRVNANKLILSEVNLRQLLKVDNPDDGWNNIKDEAKNEHIFTHDAYPGLRFSYPISLPGAPLIERPSSDGTLYFEARTAAARFSDMPTTAFIQDNLAQNFFQIGLNDEAQSANYRPPWQRIIYHQGYRAGSLSLNVPLAEFDLAAPDCYSLVAMSRDSLSHIAPPRAGWDWYWRNDPRILQYGLYFSEEWDEDHEMAVRPPDFTTQPDLSVRNENGDPQWDEARFGDVAIFDVYNVLLVRNRGEWSERVGVGKVNFRAFHFAGPKKEIIVLR